MDDAGKPQHRSDPETVAQQAIFTDLALVRVWLRALPESARHGKDDAPLRAKLRHMCSTLHHRLAQAEGRGWDVLALRQRFEEIRLAISGFDRRERRAA